MIDLTKYQQAIKQFYTPEVEADLLTYSRELLVSGVGEVIGLRAKRRQGDARLQDDSAYRAAVIDKMGNVLWALASITTALSGRFEVQTLTYHNEDLQRVLDRLEQTIAANSDVFMDWHSEDLLSSLWSYAMGKPLFGDILETIAARNIENLQVRAANNLIRGRGHGEERA